MTETGKPADRKPSAAEKKKSQEALASFLGTGLDLSPFTIDPGDGNEWRFVPDLMPHQMSMLRSDMVALEKAGEDLGAIEGAFDKLMNTIRDLMIDEDQKKKWPAPGYGIRAAIWFAMTLIAGRTGFPTS